MGLCKNCFGESTRECVICKGGLCDCTSKDTCDACAVKKENDDKKPKLSTIRRSHIELYKRCPYAFYLEVIKGLQPDMNPYAQTGIDMHDLFEQGCNNEILDSHEMLSLYKKTWDAYPNDLFESEQLKDKLWKRSVDSIDTFYNVLHTLPTKPFATEEKITFSIGDDVPTVNITMDRIDLIDGELEPLDWKTGKVMVGKKLASDLQAPLYIYAIKEKYGLPVRKFKYYYLSENKERVFERVTDDVYVCTVGKREYKISLIEAIREVKQLFSQILGNQFNVPTNNRSMHYHCGMCSHMKKGICKGHDMEIWHQVNNK